MAKGLPHILKAPRAAAFCRQTSLLNTVFAVTLIVLTGMLPAVAQSSSTGQTSAQYIDSKLDKDNNGVDDLLDQWQNGLLSWSDLRQKAAPVPAPSKDVESFPQGVKPKQGVWKENLIRIVCLGPDSESILSSASLANQTGTCKTIHESDHFGGFQVLALDNSGLSTFLSSQVHDPGNVRILLDRNGTPAMNTSAFQVGARQLENGPLELGSDWSATVAILDSGCDSAHDDLGDHNSDNADGPAPYVGDASDWYPGQDAWPTYAGYRIVGWNDVTDDFPEAVGPWDYHHHGTALASVVIGGGRILEENRGIASGGRLTVVKFYDYDEVWHTWAGDYLAACAWTLEHRTDYRIRVVLSAVNWDDDLGITDAMNALVEAGLMPVAAMGNYGEQSGGPGFPASVADVLTVGSVNDNSAVSAFSGRGIPGVGKPNLMAPGGGLLADSGRITVADNEPNDTYSDRSGTSLSAAHVAGAVFMLGEALIDNGVTLYKDAQSVRTMQAVLMATGARIQAMESSDGTTELGLSPHNNPDEIRGWGQLRIDAAVNAMVSPAFPGADQTDTLSSDNFRTVIARRIKLQNGIRYLLEAVPSAGLDVDLALVNPRDLDFDPLGSQVLRRNDSPAGVSEFAFHESGTCDGAFIVVRRVSGSGTVTLRVREADNFSEEAFSLELPGPVTGFPNWGQLQYASGNSTVITSMVDLDPSARSVTVVDGWGIEVPGWPVFVFPHPSSIGGLSQPLLWNMDGIEGDQIVVSPAFGSLYFFNSIGAYGEVALDFNVPLTTPVGLQPEGGLRQIATVDDHAVLRLYSWGPVLQTTREMGFGKPVQPAVGVLTAGGPELLVLAFDDGNLTVVNSLGEDQPGWPLDLGQEFTLPPILADTDADGDREILLPVFEENSGTLSLRVFEADGTPGTGDGSLLPPPDAGIWTRVSDPVMAGSHYSGDLRLEMMGLSDNLQSGVDSAWQMSRVGWFANNMTFAEPVPGFSVHSTNTQGVLQLDQQLMSAPIAWNYQGGPGSEISIIAGFRWREILYGQTAIGGSTSGCFLDSHVDRPLESKFPLGTGGSAQSLVVSAALGMTHLEGDRHYKIQVVGKEMLAMPVEASHHSLSSWPLARFDQKNTGAYPAVENLSSAGNPLVQNGHLQAFPNPSAGRFNFSLQGAETGTRLKVDVYDLRGRKVASLTPSPESGNSVWDGQDQQGRAAAAGTYLAVARWQNGQSVTRVVLAR